jgi:hypothetical protein
MKENKMNIKNIMLCVLSVGIPYSVQAGEELGNYAAVKNILSQVTSSAKVMACQGTEWVVNETRKHPYIAGGVGAGVVGSAGFGIVCYRQAMGLERKAKALEVAELRSLLTFLVERGRKDPQRKYRARFFIAEKIVAFTKKDIPVTQVALLPQDDILNGLTVITPAQFVTCSQWWADYENSICRKNEAGILRAEQGIRELLQIPADHSLPF